VWAWIVLAVPFVVVGVSILRAMLREFSDGEHGWFGTLAKLIRQRDFGEFLAALLGPFAATISATALLVGLPLALIVWILDLTGVYGGP